jgi:acyl-CoA synthetase (AMP-forming)/AMP-acid ligase II
MHGHVCWGSDYATLVDRFADLPAVQTPDGECTFRELVERAAAVAAALKAAGVQPGEPVATYLRNSRAAVWSGYGVTLAGACETALNANLAPGEVAYCVQLAGVRHAVTTAAAAPMFHSLGVTAHIADEIIATPRAIDRAWSAPEDAWGKILFTSGTTGRPKAIVYNHRRRWLGNMLQRAHLPFTPGPGSCVLLMTPYTHGASLITYAYLDHGASIYLTDGVNVDSVGDLLERRAIDSLFAPPTVLAKLVAAFEGLRFPDLRVIFTGTATLTPSLYGAARAIFGPIVRVTYGKSEMINPITVLPPDATDAFFRANPVAAAANLGWPAAGVEVAIRDEHGRDCAAGADGEIHLRSPHMLSGYIDGEGYHALGSDDWHATGDIGHLAATGELFLAGRAGDVIKSGGYKIYPQEIELALAQASGATNAVAVGVPSDYWGEVIVAVAEGASAQWEASAAAAAQSLTRFKQPRAYLTLEALPRVGQDKISRKRIVEAILEHYRLEDGPHPRLIPR